MLKINEIFGPTIQGEGKSLGKEVIFIRLALCNLHCVWCDTPYSWDYKKFNLKKEVHEMDEFQIVEKIQSLSRDVMSIVISGGEPLIQQWDLISLCTILKGLGYWIEIETNGTFEPLPALECVVDQFNCSPKMENSGNSLKARLHPHALKQLNSNRKTNFKFVVSSEEDIKEILDMIEILSLKDIYLMPEGRTREELEDHEELVERLCKKHKFHFTNREHILRYGTRRGV